MNKCFRTKARIISLFLACIMMVVSFPLICYAEDKSGDEEFVFNHENAEIIANCDELCKNKQSADLEKCINAKSYCLIEKETGRVILSKNEHEQLAVASTTKIMSALIAIRQNNLDEYFTVDKNAIYVEGTSMGLMPDFQVTMRSLAIGMLLKSGNDAANAAAVKVAGSIEEFAKLMNHEAQLIGMKNTKFSTPSGLDYGSPYSSAFDMAQLARRALDQPEFAEICREQKLQVSIGNPPEPRYIWGHNGMLGSYEGAIGVKTGYTKKSGKCLVSAAERNGVTLICVSLNTSDVYGVHSLLFDYGFSVVSKHDLENADITKDVEINGGIELSTSVTIPKESVYLFNSDNIDTSKIEKVEYYTNLSAPIFKNQIIGEVVYKINGTAIKKVPVISNKTVYSAKEEKQKNKFNFLKWIKGLFIKEKALE